MGYLICEKCGGYYELQEGESIDDFQGCECGGKFRYAENIDDLDQESNTESNKSSSKKRFNLVNGLNKRAILIGLIFGIVFGVILFFRNSSIFVWGLITLISGSLTGYLAGGTNRTGMKNGFMGSFGTLIVAIAIFIVSLINPSLYGTLVFMPYILTYPVLWIVAIISVGIIGLIGGLVGSIISTILNKKDNVKDKNEIKENSNIFCSKCGSENEEDALFCVKCGKELEGTNNSTNPLKNFWKKKYLPFIGNIWNKIAWKERSKWENLDFIDRKVIGSGILFIFFAVIFLGITGFGSINSSNEQAQTLVAPAWYSSNISEVNSTLDKASNDLDTMENRFPAHTSSDIELLTNDSNQLDYLLYQLKDNDPPKGFEEANRDYIYALTYEIKAINDYNQALGSTESLEYTDISNDELQVSEYRYDGLMAFMYGNNYGSDN